MATLALEPGMRVLDAGCGTGEALHWLAGAVGTTGSVLGIDLSHSHVEAARISAPPGVEVLQADLGRLELPAASFDVIWCVNTLNHFREPLDVLAQLRACSGQGAALPWGKAACLRKCSSHGTRDSIGWSARR